MSYTGWTKEQYVTALRMFLRDTDDQNVLTCGKLESTDEELCLFLDMALDYFNRDIPYTCFAYENFPSKHWLIFRAAIESQFSIGILNTRNMLDYNDGGRSYRVFGKQQSNLSFISAMIAQTEQHKRAMKRNINAQKFYGQIISEYSFINNYVFLD